MTYQINFASREVDVLEKLAAGKELTPSALLRQALRVYQLVDYRLTHGDRLFEEPVPAEEKEIRALLHPDS